MYSLLEINTNPCLTYARHNHQSPTLTLQLRRMSQGGRSKRTFSQDNPGTAFAMAVVQAVRSGNTYKFFQLYSAKKAQDAVTALAPYTPASKKHNLYKHTTNDKREGEGEEDSPAATNTPFSAKKTSKTPKTPVEDSTEIGAGAGVLVSPSDSAGAGGEEYDITLGIPHLACYLMDFLLHSQREQTMERVLKGYMSLPLHTLFKMMNMLDQDTDKNGNNVTAKENMLFLKRHGLKIVMKDTATPANPDFEPYLDCVATRTARAAAAADADSTRTGTDKSDRGAEKERLNGHLKESKNKKRKRQKEEAVIGSISAGDMKGKGGMRVGVGILGRVGTPGSGSGTKKKMKKNKKE